MGAPVCNPCCHERFDWPMGEPSPTEAQCEGTLGLYSCDEEKTYACLAPCDEGLCFYQMYGDPWCSDAGPPGWFPVCSSYAMAKNTCITW